jgi:purine-cytosine permease-like protein
LGSLIYAPFALVGRQTGTNSAVSSGATFGVKGRIFGSAQNLLIGIGFFALAVWTGGQAAVAGLNRLAGLPNNSASLVVAFLVIGLGCILVATYGHANVVVLQRFALPLMGLLIVVGFIVFAHRFNSHAPVGPYILGSYWPTWLLSMVTAASLPISYAPFVNDYARYISPDRARRANVLIASGVGMFVGCAFALLFATYTASMMPVNVSSWVGGLVAMSPTWYVVPIIVVGIGGSLSQGALCVYGNGLDVSSIIPRLRRYLATAIIGIVGIAVVIVGQFASSLQTFAASFLIILVVVTTPWMFIILIGHFLLKGRYDPADLQVFNRGERGGRYWYQHGYSLVALCVWVPAMVVGLLFADTTIYVGPLANALGSGTGGYLCFVAAAVIALVLYPILVTLVPSALLRGGRGGGQENRDFAAHGSTAPVIAEGVAPIAVSAMIDGTAAEI